jgi:hypothetical protein
MNLYELLAWTSRPLLLVHSEPRQVLNRHLLGQFSMSADSMMRTGNNLEAKVI